MRVPNIQLIAFVKGYLPPALRLPRFMALLRALLAPWSRRNDELNTFAATAEKEANIIPQVAILEAVLNELFDPSNSIYIDHSTDGAYAPVVYFLSEAQPLTLYLDNSYSPTGDNPFVFFYQEVIDAYKYVVHVPAAVWATYQPRIIAIIKKYQLAGTSFKVVTF